ncbi:MAG: MYXO-CTERM sorting domain-containing protein [Polyangiaceae bacterium]
MSRWLKYSWYAALAALGSGCAGSCSSCSSCGVTPLDGGFENGKRIDNAASVRLTDSGLSFLEGNIGSLANAALGSDGGIVTFDVPSSSQTFLGIITVNICPNGPKPTGNPKECVFEANIGSSDLTLHTEAPHHLVIGGTIDARLESLPLTAAGANTRAVLNNGGNCNGNDWAKIGVDARISIETETDPAHDARRGYSRVKIESVSVSQSDLNNSLAVCANGGIWSQIVAALAGSLVGQFVGPLVDSLTGTIEDQLCMKNDPAAGVTCPAGTAADADNVCRFSNGDCVGTALGLDGNIDLSGFLASISPGTEGGLDFMLAAGGEGTRDDGSGMLWGDLNPIGGGATLGMMGGAEPRPVTTCVPLASQTLPTGIPIPDELTANTVSDWTGPGPHLGIGLSERYINYALGSAYNSGALCLGIGSDTLGSLLTSDTLGLLIPSLKDIARQKKTAPLAIVLRPQTPPSAVVGNGTSLETDPTLRLALNELIIDFYLWSNDRYIRAFSSQFDLDVPVNLDVDENSALAPVLQDIGVANPTMFNAPLVREDKQTAAETLANLLAGQIGGALGGAISPISLNDSLASLGLALRIPPTVEGQGSPGLRKLSKGSDNYLGIFASLETASGAYVNFSETDVRLMSKTIDPAGLRVDTATKDNLPAFELQAKSSLDRGEQPIEYQYRLDKGYWRPWQKSSSIKVSDAALRIQGRHVVEVRSRVEGAPQTVDRTPPTIEVLVDKSLPEITLGKEPVDGKLSIEVYDVVSPTQSLDVRWALDDGAFTDWSNAAGLEAIEVGDAGKLTVEVRDEEGNVASQSQALVRGRADASLADGSGCGCSVPGQDGSKQAPLGLLAVGAMALGFGLRRRRKGTGQGPKADAEADESDAVPSHDEDFTPAELTSAQRRRRLHRLAQISLFAVAASFNGCSCSDADSNSGNNGGSGGMGGTAGTGGGPPTCTECETLAPGLVGAYASAAVASDGTIWVAAYDDIGLDTTADGTNPILFGDLAVGKYVDGEVQWQAVDGLPDFDPNLDPGAPGGPPDPKFIDVNSYRGGLTDSGDDVGLWTSIQVGGDGLPMVAYYDATNRALKFARRDDTGAWSAHTVQQVTQGDVGRYAKLLLRDGRPVIAYLALEPAGAGGGLVQSVVRVASASTALPQGSGDWSFADAAVSAAPCRAYNCASGEECRDTGVCQTPLTTCDPACAKGEACFDDGSGAACTPIFDQKFVDTFPEGSLYISAALTSSGMGLVYYDRIHGNLYGVKEEGGTWGTPMLLDGEGPGPVDTGDTGVGASLFVDGNGDWHITYSDGITETFKYMKVTGGTTPEAAQVIDDGSTDDGKAVIGDDSSVWTNGSTIYASYQDATNGLLKLGTNDGSGWQVKTLTVDGWVNGFTQVVDVNGSPQIMAHWRKADPNTVGSVIFVAP